MFPFNRSLLTEYAGSYPYATLNDLPPENWTKVRQSSPRVERPEGGPEMRQSRSRRSG
jgi:hypothetical protein